MLEKFASRHPSCVSYDDKMQFYSQVADEVRSWLSQVCAYMYTQIIRTCTLVCVLCGCVCVCVCICT